MGRWWHALCSRKDSDKVRDIKAYQWRKHRHLALQSLPQDTAASRDQRGLLHCASMGSFPIHLPIASPKAFYKDTFIFPFSLYSRNSFSLVLTRPTSTNIFPFFVFEGWNWWSRFIYNINFVDLYEFIFYHPLSGPPNLSKNFMYFCCCFLSFCSSLPFLQDSCVTVYSWDLNMIFP